jgi:hypothetical protein
MSGITIAVEGDQAYDGCGSMRKAIFLIPTSLGAIGGVYLLIFPSAYKFAILGILVACLLVLPWLARRSFQHKPVPWAYILELWGLFLPIVAGLSIFLLLWLTVKADLESIVPFPGWTAAQKADLVKYLAGVATGLAAAMVADDPEKNYFWTAYQFRKAAATASPACEADDPARYHAALMDSTFDNTAKGWGFCARRKRALILAQPRRGAKAKGTRRAGDAAPS